MNVLNLEHISKTYGEKVIFDDISCGIHQGDKIGIIGINGTGKTTFLRILAGFEETDEGQVVMQNGLRITYLPQHPEFPEGATILSYVIQGQKEQSWNSETEAHMVLNKLGIEDHEEEIAHLSGGQKKRVALAAVLVNPADVLILDEPTSSLDDEEVEKLFVLMRRLREEGVGIIFVTHFLEQVYAVCDRITVLRNGELVGEYETKDLPRVMLVAKMMGKDFDDLADIKGDHKDKKVFSETPVIEAEGIGHKGTIRPFDLKINKGEVIGLTGLLGSGRSELVRSIYGADKADSGTLKVNGKEVKINSPLDAMKLGMAYLPEDRKAEGIIADLSVRENIIIAMQAKKGMFHPMSRKEMEEAADKYIDMLQIKTASRETPIKSLSGGNQQKVILGRWLLTNPEYLILDEPTRGIDIGTKTEIQKIVLDLADQGMAVTFISSEVEEMLRTCSRMAVLRDGEKVGELEESELSQSNIMKAIAGGDDKNE